MSILLDGLQAVAIGAAGATTVARDGTIALKLRPDTMFRLVDWTMPSTQARVSDVDGLRRIMAIHEEVSGAPTVVEERDGRTIIRNHSEKTVGVPSGI